MTGQDALTYEIFRTGRQRDIEGLRFPGHLIPLNQFYSVPNSFAQLGSGSGMHPFKTVKDYEDFLERVDGFVLWTDQAIVNMREGMAKGYVLPRVLVERVLPQLTAQVVEKPEDSVYWGPIGRMPESFTAAERDRLTAAYRGATSTCPGRAPASASTRCRTARPGTSTTSATSPRPATRRPRSTRSACARSIASTARCARSWRRSASRAASTSSSDS